MPRSTAGAFRAGLAAVLALAFGCGSETHGNPRPEITLYAAASLRDALLDLEPSLERELGVELTSNLGSSGDLARQIVAGGRADLFLSADEVEMDRVATWIEPGTRRDLLTNVLVVIEPVDPSRASPFGAPFDARQLAVPGVRRLSLANPDTVPAGRYAKAWLERRGVWSEVRERVLPGVDVRAALAAVESAGADAGIVYRTDAARSGRVRVVHAVVEGEAPPIVYPVALLANGGDGAAARRVLAFLEGPAATAAFEARGFGVIPSSR